MDEPVFADLQEFIYHQLCADTGCSLKDLLGANDDRDGEKENQGKTVLSV